MSRSRAGNSKNREGNLKKWAGNSNLLLFRVGISKVQGNYVGFNTGNGKKLSYSQAEPGRARCLAAA